MTKKARPRNYATVVYPESAPEDWMEILSMEHVPVFVSPLHDQDTDPGKEPKKPHYHVMVMFEGHKDPETVRGMFEKIGGVGLETVQSIRGYARYLCHLDNPEKAQYDTEQVRCMGGADYAATIGLPLDRYKLIGEMLDYCEDENNGIGSYYDLLLFCREYRADWFRILCDSGTYVMKEYFRSRRVYKNDGLGYRRENGGGQGGG